jgi:hypothetical protein
MGCASAELIEASFYDNHYRGMLKRRWGLLLEVEYPEGVKPLRHGAMESSYTRHYSQDSGGEVNMFSGSAAEVTFTASTSVEGRLLLGMLPSLPILSVHSEHFSLF